MSGAHANTLAHECAEFERLSLSDPTRAVAEGDALLARLRALDDPQGFSTVSRALIIALPHVGAPQEAIRRAAAARRFARGRAPAEAARVLIAAMHPRARLGNLRGAMRAGERAVRELEVLGEHALVARAELNLANVAKALGQPQRAVAIMRRVLERGDAIAPIRGQALNALGEACVQAADLPAARAAFEEALAVFTRQEHAFACAVVAGNLADTAARAGEIEEALRGFRDARERFAALGAHAEASRNAIEEATLLGFSGFLADARDRARDAGALADQHGLAAESARARLVVGSSLLAASDPLAAEVQLVDAERRFVAMGDAASGAQALTLLARCVRETDAARAASCADSAVAAARKAAAPIELASALSVRAALRAAPADGEADASEAVEIAESLGIPALRAESRSVRAAVSRRSGATERAIADARIALSEVERTHRSLELARTRRAFLAHRSDIAAELAASLVDAGSPDALEEAFDALDRCRSLAILDAILRPTQSSETPRMQALDTRVHELLAGLDPRISRPSAADAARVDRDAQRAELDRALAERRAEPSPHAASGRALSAPCVALLAHDGRLSLLARMPDGSTRARTHETDLVALAGLESEFSFEVARRLQGATSARALQAGRRAAEALRAAIHPAFSDLLDGWCGTVVVLQSPAIARIPAAILCDDSQDACLAPSLEVARLLDQPARSDGGQSALVVAVHDASTPGIAREGEEIARRLATHMPTARLDGADATRARFVDALSRASVAHVACHGVFPPDAPNLAGLVIADGWFTARDAHALATAPEEVVLSGCVTAASARQDGEEWMGLVRGFAAAGTRRMAASLWPVDDAATASFMERLYSHGPAPCRALSGLARELRAEGEHPAVWGAFCTIGGASTHFVHS
ncbi:MAG: CHAT domain-containing protein [Phycisphaera sp.]|nr:CHAT domain-containing protein [Phycisphaera sp.]